MSRCRHVAERPTQYCASSKCSFSLPLDESRGINVDGLKRRGFDADRLAAIRRAYRTLCMSGARLEDERVQLAELARDSADVRLLLDFLGRSERPLLR